MKKVIVTTTIQSPTEATYKFSKMKDWTLIIVGDLKTPHEEYLNKGNWIYLPPEDQEKLYPELSDAIGWNCIMRRNIGFIFAYDHCAEIIASVDDDNIPYDNWGEEIFIGQEIHVNIYNCNAGVFDPMQLTNHPELWHRGYPIDRIHESKTFKYYGIDIKRKVLFQANFWNGDPDIDALCRLIYNPTDLKLEITAKFSSNNFIPFNSQNTFIAREALPYYMMLPYIGRMDDIWGGYIAQYLLNTRPIFMKATTYQQRNSQDIYKNLNDELFGYRQTSKFLHNMKNFRSFLPEKTLKAFDIYRRLYHE